MGEVVSFERAGGGQSRGWLSTAKRAGAPGVVVIQEWWGLQGQIKAVCERLAAEDFSALAPDLYGGKVIPYHDSAAASAAMQALDFRASVDEAVRGAVQRLAADGGKVGLTGFCMGGAVTVAGAARIPELSAAVCFYGLPPEGLARPEDVKVPLQCHFAAQDDWVKPELADAFEKRLRAAGKTFEVYRYPGHHAFMNSERGEVHDAAAAELAWERCLQFFRRHLAG